jgi:hypothetical protein
VLPSTGGEATHYTNPSVSKPLTHPLFIEVNKEEEVFPVGRGEVKLPSVSEGYTTESLASGT